MKLEKYHGWGNDFLVLLDADGDAPLDADLARRLCDRHLGVGADGLIRASRGSDDKVSMELRNADGSEAETSGNGLRCLARALLAAGWATGPRVEVVTAAGPRSVTLLADGQLSVDMGPARVELRGDGTARVDMGNPHLVVQALDGAPDGTVNVELLTAGPEPDAVTMRVWERGVGETRACGTGACAAAAAAHEWGWVGTVVTVHQAGGDALVELAGDTVVLTGPAEHVATVEVCS